ncbi:hypothetical protein LINPERPRIM_LOCUS7208 [Linum perenne]
MQFWWIMLQSMGKAIGMQSRNTLACRDVGKAAGSDGQIISDQT